jgi:hypothetical protein
LKAIVKKTEEEGLILQELISGLHIQKEPFMNSRRFNFFSLEFDEIHIIKTRLAVLFVPARRTRHLF